ncbi:hypothetical protein CAEBREN_00714 [Caenorhabditis brenneri]|uniref:Uncharacterized protein n=1 Tax=Caenorhabditis brenneri TaxID=135651 RepID=G0PJJ6_CAEBE|nr:hypothetical protein CAEBREN_00714 [Caenorhabditis brenneri]
MRVMLYMLLLSILVLITTKQESTYKELFNFREKVLEQFNVVRRFFAAGDFAKLYELVSLIFKFFGGNLRENIMGPAANMYQLKWSRRLEEISFEYMEKELNSNNKPNILKSIEYKNHIGFIWMGNILDLIKDFLDGIIPTDAIEHIKEALAEVFKYVCDSSKKKLHLDIIILFELELFITIIWIAAAAPDGLYLERGVHYGPVEALFAERYEIGCWSDPFFSVCFLDP